MLRRDLSQEIEAGRRRARPVPRRDEAVDPGGLSLLDHRRDRRGIVRCVGAGRAVVPYAAVEGAGTEPRVVEREHEPSRIDWRDAQALADERRAIERAVDV